MTGLDTHLTYPCRGICLFNVPSVHPLREPLGRRSCLHRSGSGQQSRDMIVGGLVFPIEEAGKEASDKRIRQANWQLDCLLVSFEGW